MSNIYWSVYIIVTTFLTCVLIHYRKTLVENGEHDDPNEDSITIVWMYTLWFIAILTWPIILAFAIFMVLIV
jgi:hypothetical protein